MKPLGKTPLPPCVRPLDPILVLLEDQLEVRQQGLSLHVQPLRRCSQLQLRCVCAATATAARNWYVHFFVRTRTMLQDAAANRRAGSSKMGVA